MKKIAWKILATALIATLFSGCAMQKLGERGDLEGKVWRARIYQTIGNNATSKMKGPIEELTAKANYVEERDGKMRMTIVQFFSGSWLSKMSNVGAVAVPDSVEYTDLGKGAIVDVIFQPGDDFDFSKEKMNRLVKVVCKGSDRSCIKQEWSEGRVNTVIDPSPSSNEAYGNTYRRRYSDEEIAKARN